MKIFKRRINKLLSVFLVLTIVFSMFSGLGLTVSAATNSHFEKVADEATLDGWKAFFGTETTSTENAGGVWTDKSVFVDGSEFTGLTDAYNQAITPTVSDNSFLVALSVIASNKSIVGYSHIPTDTVLVLDVSSSMGPGYQSHNNDAIAELVAAANSAMTELLAINENNRIGVVLYWADTTTFLPIDRYTTENTISAGSEILKFFETNSARNEITISQGVKNGNGDNVTPKTQSVRSGTYIQGGLGIAADMFKERSDAGDTVITGDGFQTGTQRKPVVVLMTDGAPSYGTTNYSEPGDSTIGLNATSTNNFAFLTQLTASAIKKDITSYYNSETLFYTLGFKIGNDATARSVLDPKNSTQTLSNYWNTYNAASVGSNVTIGENGQTVTVRKSGKVDDIAYNNAYYSADSNDALEDAFDSIVKEIIIQSLYRPTLVENNNANMEGYIEFVDDIGDFMAVKQIEGIMIGNKLYTGEKLCENFRTDGGELGTVQNPNELGDNLIWAVQKRLGIDDIEVARKLVTLAYEHGQLSYTDENNYSNYIGWYADNDGNYLGFWDESHNYSQMPTGAMYINKSYGMLGEIVDGHNVSDLMYVSIQVHTEIVPLGTLGTTEKDIIVPGHAQMIFRVPASLIPVVNYEVELEGTGYEDAQNIEMTISDAEPLRLLFEVGLRDDINEYNIEEIFAELDSEERNKYFKDDKYVFYTNEWSQDEFDKEIDLNNNEHIDPTDSINTLAYFEPSYENERYYYNEPTPIYVKQGSTYVKYSSDTQPTVADENEYYRQINVFELTGNGNEAEHKQYYEIISDAALGSVVKSDTNGGWNIQKETIHRVYDEIETEKTSNLTGTLRYSYFPTVQQIEGTHYYADAILGNNGKLTVTPVTGISITKTIDETLAGTTHDFTFNVDIGDESATYSVVRSFDGNYIDDGETILLDANGKGTVNIKPGETVLIVGIPASIDYFVEEDIPDGANYEVSLSSGTSGTVEQYHLSEVKFENTLSDGNLVITKQIEHPFVTVPDSINNHIFKFDVTLSGYNEGDTVEAYYSTDIDDVFNLTVSDGKIDDVELLGNQSIVILAKVGTEVTVIEDESEMPTGFILSNTQASENKTIASNSNVVYVFTNIYAPDAVSPDITIKASKKLTGRPWNNDNFTFALYSYNKHEARYDEIARETVNSEGEFGSVLTAAMNSEVFTEVGTYHYSIREIVPSNTYGITYDIVARDFNVIVTDNDTDGKLEINAVTNANHTTVTNRGNDYTVVLDEFENTYKVDGIAEVVVQIKKTVDTPDGINYSPEGFQFGVYDAVTGGLVSPLYDTNADGITQFAFTFNTDGVDYYNSKTFNYVIKEIDTGLGGIKYADEIPFTVTVKDSDNHDGTIVAITNITNTNNDVYIVDVTNVYTTQEIEVTFEATKNITGRTLEEGEFKFDLVNDVTKSVELDDVVNDATGNVVFSLNFDKVGDYKYIVREDEVNGNGVTVDTTEHEVTIVVDHDGEGNLTATVNGTVFTGTAIDIGSFNNIYEANSVDVTLEATKTIDGRDLNDKEFKFALKNVDTDTFVQEDATNDVDGKVVFDTMTFDTVGTYNYIVYENEVDGNGVTVDTTKYAVTITVTDDKIGQLVAETKVDGNVVTGSISDVITFKNVYDAVEKDVVITVKKILDGKKLVDQEFEFELCLNDKVIATAKNDIDGNVKFENVAIDDEGEYVFAVKEVKGNAKGITYDEKVYTVKVTATDNLDGTYSLVYAYADQNGAVDEIVFNNKYTPEPTPTPEVEPTPQPQPDPTPEVEPTPEPQPEPVVPSEPQSPKTDDRTNLSAWLAVVFISGAMVFATGKKIKKLSK